jgi:DNA-binding CsgD family transcriptional regulator
LGRFDPISIVEATYETLDAPTDEEWLREILRAFGALATDCTAVIGYTFRVTDVGTIEAVDLASDVLTSDVIETWRSGVAAMSPRMAQRCYLESNAGTLSQLAARGDASPEDFALYERVMRQYGVIDGMGLCACDAEGWGVNVSWLLPVIARADDRERVRLTRLAVHLATAFRLRRRLRAQRPAVPDAVLRTDGTLVHAEPAARARETREKLQHAVAVLDRARGELRHIDSDRALMEWKPLTDTRWSLVDSFESDGKRYVVARENASRVGGSRALTERERQIVEHVRLGQSSKVIAYTLGISDATVRVLLARVYAKLGVRGRAQLLASLRR